MVYRIVIFLLFCMGVELVCYTKEGTD